MLVNKSLFTAYECDMCNDDFGKGIEQDLGNWSKPKRTMARIRGKSGVPTLNEVHPPVRLMPKRSGCFPPPSRNAIEQ